MATKMISFQKYCDEVKTHFSVQSLTEEQAKHIMKLYIAGVVLEEAINKLKGDFK